MGFAEFKEMRDTVCEMSAGFDAALDKAKGEARDKVNMETRKIREESKERAKPILDEADRIWDEESKTLSYGSGSKTFDFLMDGARRLADAGDFLAAARVIDLSWYRQPANQAPTSGIRERARNELIGRVFECCGAIPAEELVRVLSWLGTGADLGRFPGAGKIIPAAISELKSAGQFQMAFELGAYWQMSTYANTPLPVSKPEVEELFARWNRL